MPRHGVNTGRGTVCHQAILRETVTD